MRFQIHPLVAAVALCLAAPAYADQPGDEISEVVVTAGVWESTAGAAVLNANDLRHLRAATSDSAALLRSLAGVSLCGTDGDSIGGSILVD